MEKTPLLILYKGERRPMPSKLLQTRYEPRWLEAVGRQEEVHKILSARLQQEDVRRAAIAVEGYRESTASWQQLVKGTVLGFGHHGAAWRVGSLEDIEKSMSLIHDLLAHQGEYTAAKTAQIDMLDEDLRERVFLAVERFQPIVIHGPSGTGKSRLARLLHQLRFGSSRSFVERNLANLDLPTFENTLCGHFKGAYTGATQDTFGAFHASHGGTLFLDEFAETSLPLQTKLLKYLNDANDTGEVEFTRPGGTAVEKSMIWILCATNKSIQEAIQRRELRSDIMQRFALQLQLPSFKQKCEYHEAGSTLKYFLTQVIREHVASLCQVTGWLFPAWLPDEIYRQGRKLILGYTWPGNDRQFRRVIQSVCYRHVSNDEMNEVCQIERDDLVASLRDERLNWGYVDHSIPTFPPLSPDARVPAVEKTLHERYLRVKELEHEVMEQAFEEHGNHNAAAKVIGMHRQKYKSQIERFRKGDHLRSGGVG